MNDARQIGRDNEGSRKVDIIWNVTRVCPWNCAICCVDAVHVTRQQELIQIRSRALKNVEDIERQSGTLSIYDQAAVRLQAQGLELDLDGKLRVLNHLEGFGAKLDISGGDPLVVSENFILLKQAALRLGRDYITLTTTGAGLAAGRYQVDQIAPLIGELNFTYDSVVLRGNESRPDGYAIGNLRKAAQFARAGVLTRGECPLTVENIGELNLRQLYLNLHEAGIHKLLLMRLFTVGRGTFDPEAVPSVSQYRRAIGILREMEARYKTPVLKLQCALKHFEEPNLRANPCDLVRESYGLMADGTLLASPWAVGGEGTPLHDDFVLGNLARTPLRDILMSSRVEEFQRRENENFGHCKIQAFLHSQKETPFERIFDKADPLYTSGDFILNGGATPFADAA